MIEQYGGIYNLSLQEIIIGFMKITIMNLDHVSIKQFLIQLFQNMIQTIHKSQNCKTYQIKISKNLRNFRILLLLHHRI